MTEPTKVALQVGAWASFVAGLFMILFSTRSSGEAPQTFSVEVTWSTTSIVGVVLVVVASAVLTFLYLLSRKRPVK